MSSTIRLFEWMPMIKKVWVGIRFQGKSGSFALPEAG